jgi:hypothetical protein
MKLSFEDFVITKGDFEFFEGLKPEEKIFFLYDLLCEEIYGPGSSVEETLFEDIELEEDDISLLDHPEEVGKQEFLTNFDDIAKTYERVMAGKMQVIADATLDINVTVLNNFVVFNAIDLDLIRQEVTSLGMEGYILRKHQTSAKAQRIFQHQKFCMVYEIMGKISGYSKN